MNTGKPCGGEFVQGSSIDGGLINPDTPLSRRSAILAGFLTVAASASAACTESGVGSSSTSNTPASETSTSLAPTGEAIRRIVAPEELPTAEQLSLYGLGRNECFMYSIGAFKTKDGTTVSRPIVSVNGRLTAVGEDACNGGKVGVGKGDRVRYFAFEDWPYNIIEVFPENGEETIAATRLGYMTLRDTLQGVGVDERDFMNNQHIAVLLKLSDDEHYPVGCRNDGQNIDPQTLVNTDSANLDYCRQ